MNSMNEATSTFETTPQTGEENMTETTSNESTTSSDAVETTKHEVDHMPTMVGGVEAITESAAAQTAREAADATRQLILDELQDIRREIENFDPTDEVDMEWVGCSDGSDIASEIRDLGRSSISELMDSIEELADRMDGYDSDEILRNIELSGNGYSDMPEMANRLQNVIDAVDRIVVKVDVVTQEVEAVKTIPVSEIEILLRGVMNDREHIGKLAGENSRDTIEQHVTWKQAVAKFDALVYVERMIENMLDQNK